MIELNTLEEQCPKCNGKGGIENTTWYHNFSVNKFRFQVLETEDKSKVIKNEIPDHESMLFFCRNCNGRGKVLTAEGKRLMEFVRFWLNPNY